MSEQDAPPALIRQLAYFPHWEQMQQIAETGKMRRRQQRVLLQSLFTVQQQHSIIHVSAQLPMASIRGHTNIRSPSIHRGRCSPQLASQRHAASQSLISSALLHLVLSLPARPLCHAEALTHRQAAQSLMLVPAYPVTPATGMGLITLRTCKIMNNNGKYIKLQNNCICYKITK